MRCRFESARVGRGTATGHVLLYASDARTCACTRPSARREVISTHYVSTQRRYCMRLPLMHGNPSTHTPFLQSRSAVHVCCLSNASRNVMQLFQTCIQVVMRAAHTLYNVPIMWPMRPRGRQYSASIDIISLLSTAYGERRRRHRSCVARNLSANSSVLGDIIYVRTGFWVCSCS